MIGNMGGLLKQAQQMQKKMQEVQENAKNMIVQGSSGAGVVKIDMNGNGLAVKIDIAESILNDKEMLEDLVIAAFNDAKSKVDEKMQEQMEGATGGLKIPGLKF